MVEITCKEAKELELQEDHPYFWCQCGKTQNSPFCDGTHKGSGIKSLPFKVEVTKRAFLCTCLKTKTRPYCDGSQKD